MDMNSTMRITKITKAIRNLILLTAIMLLGIVIMPKNVWAANSTTIDADSSINIDDSKTINATYSIDAGYTIHSNYSATATLDPASPTITDDGAGHMSLSFTAKSAGTVTMNIWITEDGPGGTKSDEKSCTVTITAAPKSVTVTPSSVTINQGEDYSLTATPTGYSTTDIEWSSSDTGVATVDASGKVTGVSAGTCTITAHEKTESGVTDGTCTVKVNSVAGALTVNKSGISLLVGDTDSTVIATGTPTASVTDITFTSGDSSVATVTGSPLSSGSSTATVTGVKTGNTTITVTATIAGNTETETFSVSVSPKVTKIEADTSGRVSAGYKTAAITPVITQSTGGGSGYDIKDITWTALTPSLATITKNSDGKIVISGIKKGTATFSAKVGDYTESPISITVEQPATSYSPNIKETSLSTPVNLSTEGKITPADSDSTTVTYECTSKPSGATDPISGSTFNAGTAGTYTIKATVSNAARPKKDGTTAIDDVIQTFTITVAPGVMSFTLPETIYITKDFTRDIKDLITVSPSGAKYKSLAITPASTSKVSADGSKLKGKETGDTTIIAVITNYDGTTVTATGEGKVKVLDKPDISYSDSKLSFKLPSKIYTGGSHDIAEVKKGMLKVYYEDDCLWTSDKSSDYADGKSLNAEAIQSIIKKSEIYDKVKSVDKDECTLTFRLYGADSDHANEDAYDSAEVKVYRQTVSGTGITTTKEYGVKGASIKLTATPQSGYTFQSWSDGSNTNPKSITVDGAKTYNATGVLGAKANDPKNAAGGAAGASGGNSKYDKVPKTGEAGDIWALWVVFIACFIGAGAVLVIKFKPELLRKSKKTSGK